jgi:small subunit ribosomal protein S13
MRNACTERRPKPWAAIPRSGLDAETAATLVEKIYFTKVYPDTPLDQARNTARDKYSSAKWYMDRKAESALTGKGVVLNGPDTWGNSASARKYSCVPDRIENVSVAGKQIKLEWRKTVLANYDKFYGVGRATLRAILLRLGISEETRMCQLTEIMRKNLEKRLTSAIVQDKAVVEAYIDKRLLHHQKIGTHRGRRQRLGYPSRGQSTRTNAKSSRWIAQKIQALLKKERMNSGSGNPNHD